MKVNNAYTHSIIQGGVTEHKARGNVSNYTEMAKYAGYVASFRNSLRQ